MYLKKSSSIALIATFVLWSACSTGSSGPQPAEDEIGRDLHSYSKPELVRVRNVDLDLTVSFEKKSLEGTADLEIERADTAGAAPLILDTRDLTISKAEASQDGGKTFSDVEFELGAKDKILGAALTVKAPKQANRVRIHYATSPEASGLQWLTPGQTAGKKQPFMFSQAQAIHARSFMPIQDSPKVRVTYSAKIKTPKGLLAVMSAEDNYQGTGREGEYSFKMTRPIPSYLIALAVGDLEFKSLGERSGVYTEPSMIEKASYELADTEKMIEATEKLYGQYRWGRYDLLVLPPSFPFGGMENPELTFATPTILAGDRSLVALVAHELAHSWSGNLVTNATWRDFWLNEGFTTYIEWRILEAVYGAGRREMETVLAKKGLENDMAGMQQRDQILHVDLRGRDPDEGFTGVPYTKGALFLRHLEEITGRKTFDDFLKGYFDKFAFRSITTEEFKEYLKNNLLTAVPGKVHLDDIDEWIEKPGLPADAPKPVSKALVEVEKQAAGWTSGKTGTDALDAKEWSTQEWLHFLGGLPADIGKAKMADLDKAFDLTASGNSEIEFRWLMMSIANKYEPAYPRLEEFLTTIGRRKFVLPLFTELAKTPEGRQRAADIYKEARPGYHPITSGSVDAVLGRK